MTSRFLEPDAQRVIPMRGWGQIVSPAMRLRAYHLDTAMMKANQRCQNAKMTVHPPAPRPGKLPPGKSNASV